MAIAWFDIPERDVAAANRLYEAARGAQFSPDSSVQLTRAVFRAASPAPAPAFAARWRRAGRGAAVREAA